MPPLALPDPPLGDGVITLRGARREDRDALVAAVQDPDIPRWTTVPSPYGPAEFDAWFERQRREREAGRALWLVVDAPGAPVAGVASLHELESGRPDIGYWITREQRGRGYAVRAVRLLRRHAARLGFAGVDLLIQPANSASIRVAERAGFARVEGVTTCGRDPAGREHLRFTAPTG